MTATTMTPPSDYPLDTHLTAPADSPVTDEALTVAALLARHQAQLPITDAMIDDACRTLRAAEALLES